MTKEYAKFIERLKKRVRILEVIADYEPITKYKSNTLCSETIINGNEKGKVVRKSKHLIEEYRAKCSNHKNDIYYGIEPKSNSYYCCFCHKTGNSIDYIQEKEHVDYDRAIEILAKKYKMKMPSKLR